MHVKKACMTKKEFAAIYICQRAFTARMKAQNVSWKYELLMQPNRGLNKVA